MKKKKWKTRVLNWGTPTINCHVVITDDNGSQKYFKSATNPGDLMKFFDMAVEDAQELVEQDGINRTVSIEQVVLQKNVWVT